MCLLRRLLEPNTLDLNSAACLPARRAKQGGRQAGKDATGKYAKSAGSQLRRYNEVPPARIPAWQGAGSNGCLQVTLLNFAGIQSSGRWRGNACPLSPFALGVAGAWLPCNAHGAWCLLPVMGCRLGAAEAGRGAAQVMLERDIQATLRAWQAHLTVAVLIFVQARRALRLPCHGVASSPGLRFSGFPASLRAG